MHGKASAQRLAHRKRSVGPASVVQGDLRNAHELMGGR